MKHIILIGFMGCGKTSVGKELAQKLHISFLDTDEMIEQIEGMSVSEIFESRGEASFRECETRCLMELLDKEQSFVLSVGGGLPMREENVCLLHQIGTIFYLKLSAEEVFNRLKGDTRRPLLQTADPKETIEHLMQKRAPFYENASDYTIETEKNSILQTCCKIENLLKEKEKM